jgi:hypothetical protein
MRHRRSISLYDEEQAHRDLLIYLEGISGQPRQNQALLQMCLIGFRVMAFQESGEQAYLSVRNPDLLQFGGKQRKPIVRLQTGQGAPVRTYPPRTDMEPTIAPDAPEQRQVAPEVVQAPVHDDLGAIESHAADSLVVSLEKTSVPIAEPSPSAQTAPPVIESADEPAFEYEEYDTLKLLQQLGGE